MSLPDGADDVGVDGVVVVGQGLTPGEGRQQQRRADGDERVVGKARPALPADADREQQAEERQRRGAGQPNRLQGERGRGHFCFW